MTGAAAGLGRAFALALAHRGAAVALFDTARDVSNVLVHSPESPSAGRLLPYLADVTSQPQVASAVNEVVKDLGRIDILVNNAGIYPIRPFLDLDQDLFDRVLAVNLKSVYLLCRAVIPHMLAARYGRIVNIATTGFFRPVSGHAHYAASKGGVIGLSRGLAAEFGAHGITVNCVAPGLTMTDTAHTLFPEEGVADLVRARAIPRLEYVEDVVGAVLFLVGEDSRFVTGQTLVVDGGRIMS